MQPAVPAESTFDLDTALARAADDDAATNTNADGSAKTPAEKKADFEGRTEMIGVAPLSAEAWDALRTGKAVHTLQFKGATRAAANQTYTVTVKVSDVGPPGPSRTYVQNVAISSRDMNEPPTNIALSNASVVEYFPDASVGDLAVSGDPEPLDTHALTIVTTGDDIGADHAMFAIAETQHAPAVPANSRFADLDAAKAGAAYISPFVGRLDDISSDGMGLIDEICTICLFVVSAQDVRTTKTVRTCFIIDVISNRFLSRVSFGFTDKF